MDDKPTLTKIEELNENSISIILLDDKGMLIERIDVPHGSIDYKYRHDRFVNEYLPDEYDSHVINLANGSTIVNYYEIEV